MTDNDNDLIRRGDALAEVELYRKDWAYARDAIAALPAVTPRVKPLVWECLAPRVIEAPGFNCRYQIRLATDGSIRWQGRYMGSWEDADSVDAAKAAAQADYEARILAALDMQPAPDAAAIREAALREAADMFGPIVRDAILALIGTTAEEDE